MKENILKLRALGMSYNKIAEKLKCSKSLINYYCSDGKAKTIARSKKYKSNKLASRKKVYVYLREFVWRHKAMCGCSNCNIKDPRVLDYDHINPSNKKANISKLVNRGTSIYTLKTEMRKCILLCANCHRIKTANQFNYWSLHQQQ